MLPENIDAIALFVSASTQWNYAFSGARISLNYPGVEATARMSGIAVDPDIFSKIQILERETLAVDRERNAAQNRRS